MISPFPIHTKTPDYHNAARRELFLFNCRHAVNPRLFSCALVTHAFHQGYFKTFFLAELTEAFTLHHIFQKKSGIVSANSAGKYLSHGSIPPFPKSCMPAISSFCARFYPLHSVLRHRLAKREHVSEPDAFTISRRIESLLIGAANQPLLCSITLHLPAAGEAACCCDSIISMGLASFSTICFRWRYLQFLDISSNLPQIPSGSYACIKFCSSFILILLYHTHRKMSIGFSKVF